MVIVSDAVILNHFILVNWRPWGTLAMVGVRRSPERTLGLGLSGGGLRCKTRRRGHSHFPVPSPTIATHLPPKGAPCALAVSILNSHPSIYPRLYPRAGAFALWLRSKKFARSERACAQSKRPPRGPHPDQHRSHRRGGNRIRRRAGCAAG